LPFEARSRDFLAQPLPLDKKKAILYGYHDYLMCIIRRGGSPVAFIKTEIANSEKYQK
jgi:hypothetical protein